MSKDDEWVTVEGVRYEPRHKIIEECALAVEQEAGDQELIHLTFATQTIRALKDKQP